MTDASRAMPQTEPGCAGNGARGRRAVPAPSVLLYTLLLAAPPILVGTADATCLATTFENQVHRAQVIFAGTLARREYVDVPGSVITRYTFVDLSYAKGSGPVDTLILGAEGGIGRSGEVVVEDEHQFEVGRRYILLAEAGWGRTTDLLHAMSCGTGHPFSLTQDPAAGGLAVSVGGPGYPIAALDSTHVVWVRRERWEDTQKGPRPVVYDLDANGRKIPRPPPVPPPSGPIEAIIKAQDPAVSREPAFTTGSEVPHRMFVRWISLWPHQDPGTRVSEAEFLAWLRMVVHRVAADSTLAK